jgi:hypothetical protein
VHPQLLMPAIVRRVFLHRDPAPEIGDLGS